MRAEDRGLVYAHLAVLAGLLTTLTTVFMGEQSMILFYLIAGWVQGMNPAGLGARNREDFYAALPLPAGIDLRIGPFFSARGAENEDRKLVVGWRISPAA